MRRRKEFMKLSIRNFLIISFFPFIVFLLVSCGNESKKNTTSRPVENSYLNHNDTARYVGISQCKLCHQAIYNSFIQTGMGKSFEHASKQKSSAKFSEHSVIYDKFKDFYYHPFWKNDSLMIMEFRTKGNDTIYKHVEKVDFIIGSGQHTNSHIMNTNGYLHQMPMTYYTQKGEWDFPPGFEEGSNTRFSRKIGLECMSCHNSLPGFTEGSENKFNSLPEGVSCERCHGPGSIHVQQRMKNPALDTSKYIDYSIVNPGKLSIDLQFDVCQRCHLQGNAVVKEGKSFFDFRPGMRLSDYITTFLPRYKNSDDQFIMASHADRLKQSKCFIKSFRTETDTKSLRPYKNALTCVTCHNPHVSVRSTRKDVFNNACIKCHNESGINRLCTEIMVTRISEGDNCVACHMPRSGSIDIPHVTVHDHYIRKPVKKKVGSKAKEFIGLYAVNEKNPSRATKAKAYLQQYDKFESNPVFLDSAMIYLSDKTPDELKQSFGMLIHLYFIKQDNSKILDFVSELGKENVLKNLLVKKTWNNDDAWTSYRIGEAFYYSGNKADAYLFYKNADVLSPFNPEFKNKLGASLMAQNKVDEAKVVFSSILTEDSKYVPAINNMGYACLVSGDVEKADYYYKRAILLDPDYEPLLMNMAGFNIYKKNYKEAKHILQTVIKRNPKNQQASNVLKQISDPKFAK